MATGRFQLHELLGKAGDASAWSQGKFTCIGCRRRFNSHQFETTVGSVCVSCVEKQLKKWSKTQDLLFWEVARMVTALSDDGPMDDRLTDEKWQTMGKERQRPDQPPWTKTFITEF